MDFTLLKTLPDNSRHICNLSGSSAALLLALQEHPFLAVESTEERSEELCRDINFFREALRKPPIFFLPEPDGPAVAGQRAHTVYSLAETDSLVSSFRNITASIWSREEIEHSVLHAEKGMSVSREEFEETLRKIGYRNVGLVSDRGEFSRHGWILDIFPSTAESPLRIEFFGDEIETLRFFEIETQRSGKELRKFTVFPAQDNGAGMTLLEFMGHAHCFFSDAIREREGLPEDTVFFSRYAIQGPGRDAGLLPVKGLGIMPEERKNIDELPGKINLLKKENRILLVASSEGQAERLKDILGDGGLIAPLVERKGIFEYEGRISITIGSLSSGLHLPGLLILTEKELFGGRPGYRAMKKSRVARLITALDDLRPGDFVVHRDHGIGIFHGLIQQDTEGITVDLMQIEYDGGRLYLPLHGINKISKYHAEEGITPKIDRLGGRTWQRTKAKVKKKIEDMAQKLVTLYAEREVHKGFTFSPDTELHREFDSFFPYEETPDQVKAIEDIKKDMETEKPMDRLVCGDVGYGKTEVAMRAAFKAVYDGMQAAVLVPTTILCEQHARNFKARFSAFPVTIDSLSRFKSAKNRRKTQKALADGDIDIVIGTHSLLGKDVSFHNLGLLVIDEEHRFGVRQKEKIKELRKGIDVITLTATPIPRTLSMALSDIRDMSIIETPPEERLAAKSIVSRFDRALIKEAVAREIERNGQVFFVHNRIKDIYKIADLLRMLLPSLRIAVAHGQMDEKELEQVMLQFYDSSTDVLVSTAIIGSGLDIPTANTIIINRADMMGLADLYQLKGRVGRGNVRAYAYFLIPGEEIITEEAKKRLQAIQDMSYLGAGFRLALKDLEIRGAGNLLGAEQSGHIHAIGFDLYMEMLEHAVAELKGQKIEEEFEPSITVRANAFIPEEYVGDITLRLSLYRKIASSKSHGALQEIASEVEDRFGRIPDEVSNLLRIMRLKITARELLITKIQDFHGTVRVLFSPDTKIEPRDIFSLSKKITEKMRFLPEGFELDLTGLSWDETYHKLSYLFTCLAVSDTVKEI